MSILKTIDRAVMHPITVISVVIGTVASLFPIPILSAIVWTLWAKAGTVFAMVSVLVAQGWIPEGVPCPAKYVHLSGRDIDNAYGRLHGIEPEEEDDSGKPITECWRCKEINESGDRFCSRCGAPLDEEAQQTQAEVQEDVGREKAIADLHDSEQLTEKQIEDIANDDELMAEFLKIRSEA